MKLPALALALASLACVELPKAAEATTHDAPALASLASVRSSPRATPASTPSSRGQFRLTYYWLAHEPAHAAGDLIVPLRTCAGQRLANVPVSFAKSLRLEGSGKLLDGRVLNIGACACEGAYSCFAELDAARFPWGQGSRGNALVPYASVATDPELLPHGTRLYAPALDGVALPSGETHDGCLLAADVGGGIDGAHIDWFVGERDNYRALAPHIPAQLELFDAGERCP